MTKRVPFLSFSIPIAALVAVCAYAGLFWPAVYSRETRMYTAMGTGGDFLNLFIVTPVLLVTAWLARRGSPAAKLVWMGSLVFLLYDFVYYTLAVHMNALFLAYCAVWGLSFYALAATLPGLNPSEVAERYGPRAPAVPAAIVFLWIVASAGAHWLIGAVQTILSGTPPQSVTDQGLLTEPAAVLDLSLVLPAFVITAVLLLRRKALGFVLAPVFLAFSGLICLMLCSMMINGIRWGFDVGFAPIAINVATAAASILLLGLFLRPPR